MKINFKHTLVCLLSAASALQFSSCDDFLDREPISSITPEQYFNTADELAAYAIKYYTSVCTTWSGNYNAGPLNADGDTDNMVVGEANTTYFADGRWLVPANKNMDFSMIRTCNYFFEKVLPKYETKSINGSEDLIKHYIGEMYFMRATVYFNSLMTFGDFPIITTVLPDEASVLTEASKRAPRNEVARFILQDLDKAIGLLKSGSAFNKVRISREAALLLKARVALFEATFEKYHKGTPRVPGEPGWPGAMMDYNKGKTFNIDSEVSFFLTEAMSASSEVAENHQLVANNHVINPAVNQISGWNPYFEMFSMDNPGTIDEVIMWRDYSKEQSITQGYTPYISDGGNNGMTKSYVDAFLMKNGLPIYASNSGYQGDATIDAQKANRDERLQLFVFGESDVVKNRDSLRLFKAPDIVGLTEHRDRTGFRQRKHYTYDITQVDNGINGTNGYVVFRTAEAYLIYLEASYLKNGNIDSKADKYWKALRARAGVDTDYSKTNAATDLSKEPDWAKYSGSNLVDPTLYNIRRERRCEFIGEGMRRSDLIRWRSFDALFEGNMGRYIPEGINLWTTIYTYDRYIAKDKQGNPTGKSTLIEQADGLASANVSNRNDSKYLRPYRIVKENNEVWNGYTWKKAYYLSPISVEDMTLTSTDGSVATSVIYQNPYWPSVASGAATE